MVLGDLNRVAVRSATHESAAVRALNLVRGSEVHHTTATTINARDINFIQTLGLRAGDNTIDFALERPDAVEVSSLRVYRDSGLEWSALPPGKLALHTSAPAQVRPGDSFLVRYRVVRKRGRPLENVLVKAYALNRIAAALRPTTRRIGVLRNTGRGSFRFRARGRGSARVAIHVSTGTDRPTHLIRVPVRRQVTR